MNTSRTTEERIWAVVSHLSALAFGMGILLPIIGWSEQKHKSKYASFQCLQALGYQSLGYTIWLLTYILGMVLFLVLMIIAMNFTKENSPWAATASVLWAGFIVFFALGLFALYMIIPIIAAVACGLGKEFHYPMLGKRLAVYLGNRPAVGVDEQVPLVAEYEERWVASMGHFSVIIPFWGLLAPVTTWILQGRQNGFLKFQSIQTTIYQSLVNIFYVTAIGVTWLGTIPLFTLTGLEGDPNQTSSITVVGLVLFLLSMLVALVLFLVLPLFHILGQWAGYRVLKGDNYRYPILGRLVEKRMKL